MEPVVELHRKGEVNKQDRRGVFKKAARPTGFKRACVCTLRGKSRLIVSFERVEGRAKRERKKG